MLLAVSVATVTTGVRPGVGVDAAAPHLRAGWRRATPHHRSAGPASHRRRPTRRTLNLGPNVVTRVPEGSSFTLRGTIRTPVGVAGTVVMMVDDGFPSSVVVPPGVMMFAASPTSTPMTSRPRALPGRSRPSSAPGSPSPACGAPGHAHRRVPPHVRRHAPGPHPDPGGDWLTIWRSATYDGEGGSVTGRFPIAQHRLLGVIVPTVDFEWFEPVRLRRQGLFTLTVSVVDAGSTTPVRTALTVTWSPASSAASALVSPTTPCFEVQYGEHQLVSPAAEEVLT